VLEAAHNLQPFSAVLVLALGPACNVVAQVTPDMKEAKIAAIGRVEDPPSTAQL
jgi:hypothetical protein